jgi:hypothetical protein
MWAYRRKRIWAGGVDLGREELARDDRGGRIREPARDRGDVSSVGAAIVVEKRDEGTRSGARPLVPGEREPGAVEPHEPGAVPRGDRGDRSRIGGGRVGDDDLSGRRSRDPEGAEASVEVVGPVPRRDDDGDVRGGRRRLARFGARGLDPFGRRLPGEAEEGFGRRGHRGLEDEPPDGTPPLADDEVGERRVPDRVGKTRGVLERDLGDDAGAHEDLPSA